MKALLKRHQIIIFFALTFIISWYPWYTGGHGFRAWGPSLAGLIVVAVVGGWKGIVGMLRRLVRWRVGIVWWAVALLGPPAIALVAVGMSVASIVMGFLPDVADVDTHITLLSIGLFALA